jgi:hypothetical protein
MLGAIVQPKLYHALADRLSDQYDLIGADGRSRDHLAVTDGDSGGARLEDTTVTNEKIEPNGQRLTGCELCRRKSEQGETAEQ